MIKPKVGIIVLNYNGWRDTLECLDSLFRNDYPNYSIILIDNFSTDDSVEHIDNYCENTMKCVSLNLKSRITMNEISCYNHENRKEDLQDDILKCYLFFVKNNQNYGFAEGNNIGIKLAQDFFDPDYFLLLNNDTTVEKSFLSELVNYAENDREGGFFGPKVYFYHNKTTIQFLGGGKVNLLTGLAYNVGRGKKDSSRYNQNVDLDYIGGSCLLCKKRVIKEIGLLDPKFFLYWEETDWCFRGLDAGYKCRYVYKSKIWHKGLESNASCISTVLFCSQYVLFYE